MRRGRRARARRVHGARGASRRSIVSITGYSSFSTAFVVNRHYAPLMALFDADCPLRDVVPYLVRPSEAVSTILQVESMSERV